MLEFTDSRKISNPRGSTSTIDSLTAAELVKHYENVVLPSKSIQTQNNAMNPKVHNTMTFDKSDGIHVGDVINYYCASPISISSRLNHPEEKQSESTTHSDSILISPNDSEKRKCLTFISRKSNLLLMMISLIIIAITGSILFMMRHKFVSADTEETTTIKIIVTTSTPVDIDSTTTSFPTSTVPITTTLSPTLPPKITLKSFASRQTWNAEEPRATVDLKLPINRIIMAHTASESCNTERDCTKYIQELQKNSTQLDDIPYNFLIGNDSKVYEGRGFLYEGQHTSNSHATEYDSIGISIAFIGNHEHDRITESQQKVLLEFIDYFKEYNIIDSNCTIFLQDQLIHTKAYAKGLEKTFESWKEYRKLQKIYHRNEWNAEAPKRQQKFCNHMNWTIITNTGGNDCNNFSMCSDYIKNIQDKSFDEGLNDIPFAFIIGGDGLIFEGRGWDFIGQHTPNYDERTVAICVIGSYGVRRPGKEMVESTYNLLLDGAALGKLTRDFYVNGRQELEKNLFGPGGGFMTFIRSWPQWNYMGISKKGKKTKKE